MFNVTINTDEIRSFPAKLRLSLDKLRYKKCSLCNKKDARENLHFVKEYTWEGDVITMWYHPECLKIVFENIKDATNSQLQNAANISNALARKRSDRRNLESQTAALGKKFGMININSKTTD